MAYAVQGILYVAAQPSVWLDASLVPTAVTLALGMCAVVTVFTTGLHPLAEQLERLGMPSECAVASAIAILVVETFVATAIFSLLCTPLYDAIVLNKVLEARGHVVTAVGAINSDQPTTKWCRARLWQRFLALLATSPLNCAPVVGTIAYVWLNGARLSGWEPHQRYFDMRGYSLDERRAIYNTHRDTYSTLGAHCMWLQAIPVVGVVLAFTNAVGAALFAADLEDELARAQPTYGSYHTISKDKMLYI